MWWCFQGIWKGSDLNVNVWLLLGEFAQGSEIYVKICNLGDQRQARVSFGRKLHQMDSEIDR